MKNISTELKRLKSSLASHKRVDFSTDFGADYPRTAKNRIDLSDSSDRYPRFAKNVRLIKKSSRVWQAIGHYDLSHEKKLKSEQNY